MTKKTKYTIYTAIYFCISLIICFYSIRYVHFQRQLPVLYIYDNGYELNQPPLMIKYSSFGDKGSYKIRKADFEIDNYCREYISIYKPCHYIRLDFFSKDDFFHISAYSHGVEIPIQIIDGDYYLDLSGLEEGEEKITINAIGTYEKATFLINIKIEELPEYEE